MAIIDIGYGLWDFGYQNKAREVATLAYENASSSDKLINKVSLFGRLVELQIYLKDQVRALEIAVHAKELAQSMNKDVDSGMRIVAVAFAKLRQVKLFVEILPSISRSSNLREVAEVLEKDFHLDCVEAFAIDMRRRKEFLEKDDDGRRALALTFKFLGAAGRIGEIFDVFEELSDDAQKAAINGLCFGGYFSEAVSLSQKLKEENRALTLAHVANTARRKEPALAEMALLDALQNACRVDRETVLLVLGAGAGVLSDFDDCETLKEAYEFLEELDGWWSNLVAARRSV